MSSIKKPAKSVHNILAERRGMLHGLVESCERLQRATELIRSQLPEPMNRHCRVASLSDGVAVIHCDASIWTTRLRFYCPRLLTRLRRRPEFGRLDEIRIRTAPDSGPASLASSPAGRVVPAAAAAHLRAAAAAVPGTTLNEALLRLASRADQTG